MLEHIALNVPDPQAAAAWYADNLDMRVVKSSSGDTMIHFIADAEGSMLEFYYNPAGELPDYWAMSPYTLHLAFTLSAGESVEEAKVRLLAAGASETGDLSTTPTGDELLFLRDPWGVPIQVVKRARPLS